MKKIFLTSNLYRYIINDKLGDTFKIYHIIKKCIRYDYMEFIVFGKYYFQNLDFQSYHDIIINFYNL